MWCNLWGKRSWPLGFACSYWHAFIHSSPKYSWHIPSKWGLRLRKQESTCSKEIWLIQHKIIIRWSLFFHCCFVPFFPILIYLKYSSISAAATTVLFWPLPHKSPKLSILCTWYQFNTKISPISITCVLLVSWVFQHVFCTVFSLQYYHWQLWNSQSNWFWMNCTISIWQFFHFLIWQNCFAQSFTWFF